MPAKRGMILCFFVSVITSLEEKSEEESCCGHVVLLDFSLLVGVLFLRRER